MAEKQITLTGGVICKFGKLRGEHIENLTTQGADYQVELIKMVADVTKQLGSKTNVTIQDIEGLLPYDFYRLLISIRNFSAGSELCTIRKQWTADNVPFIHPHPVNCGVDTFEVTESNLLKDSKDYVIPNEIEVLTSIGKVKMQVITVGKEPELLKLFAGKKISMLTELKIRQPKNEQGEVINLAKTEYDVLTELFEAKRQAEGEINLDVELENPRLKGEFKTVNVFSQPSFFFQWVRR